MRLARLRFTMSLRMLLGLILVFGVGLGWTVNKANGQRRALAEVEKSLGRAYYDFQYMDGKFLPVAKSGMLAGVRRVLGDDYLHTVTSVSYAFRPVSDATLGPLGELDRIEKLDFGMQFFCGGFSREISLSPIPRWPADPSDHVGPRPDVPGLTEAGLVKLEGLSRLHHLVILKQKLGGTMLNHLSRSRQLETIELVDTGMTDAGMPPLRSMPRLRELNVRRNQITGTCLAELRGTNHLEVLDLGGNPVCPAGFETIGSLASLHTLDLSGTRLDDTGASRLAALKRLRCLDLSQTRVTDAGLVHLAGLDQLEHLYLNDCRVTSQGLENLVGLTRLETLALGGTDVDNDGLKTLAGMTQLRSLSLYRTRVTGAGLIQLCGLKYLNRNFMFLELPH